MATTEERTIAGYDLAKKMLSRVEECFNFKIGSLRDSESAMSAITDVFKEEELNIVKDTCKCPCDVCSMADH